MNDEREDNEALGASADLNEVTVHEFGFDLDPDAWVDRVRQAVEGPRPEPFGTPPWGERDSDTPGQRVGAYELVTRIGEGGMGTVWRARRADHQFEREVAIKLIRAGARTRDAMRRFQLEGQVLATLAHTNIARLFDGGSMPDGRPYLVMEYVAGVSIVDYCRQRGLTVDERVTLFERVCEAVHAAHSNLVLHRDLKPSNILVTEDGAPKLLDFGIAKLLDDSGTERTAITETDARVLTPRYASPEQIRGDKLTTATDVYSLGVLLYELLTDQPAYTVDSNSRIAMERAVLESDPTRASTAVMKRDDLDDAKRRRLSLRLRGDLDTILSKALQKDIERRYASAQQLGEDLRRHLEGKSIAAAPDSVTVLLGKFVRRNKALVAAAGVATSALVIATVVSASMAIRESRARAEADRRTRIAETINTFLNEDLLVAINPENTDNPDLKMREVLDRAASKVDGRFHEEPLVEASIRSTIGSTYRGLGLPLQAIPQLKRAVALYTGEFGDEHAQTRTMRRDYVAALLESDELKGGCAEAKSLLDLDIQAAGTESADAMDTRYLFATYCSGLGNGTELLRDVLTWDLRERGEADPKTLAVMNSLVNLYIYDHKIDDAEALIQRIWDVTKKHYGPAHPETLQAMLGMAIVYGRTDRIPEAIALLKEAIEIERRTKPADYSDRGMMLGHLAEHLKHAGRVEEAEAAYAEGYEILVKTLGPESSWTWELAKRLSKLYADNGDAQNAALWMNRVPENKRD